MLSPSHPLPRPSGPQIAVIICSGRQPRVGDQVTSFVHSTIQSAFPTANLTTIDLLAWDLPMYNEASIPCEVHDPTHYTQAHTRAWSAEISKYQGFVFVSPQYNWGYPAILKNAIDYLYNEWKGKAAMVVSYGGHGGGKAAVQLKSVLEGVRMRVVETMPALSLKTKAILATAAVGGVLPLKGDGALWGESEKGEVEKVFGGLLKLLEPGEEKKGP
ncbi:putative NADPH-dependent FMN reductase [Hyaloscypha variabilis]